MTPHFAPRRAMHAATCVTACVASLAFMGTLACAGSRAGAPERVTVPAGATFREAADSLEARGIVRSARLFRWYAARTGRDRAIKPGTYEVHPGQSWRELLDALVAGKGLLTIVTIPEGWDRRTIIPRVARALNVPEDSVRSAFADSGWRIEFAVSAETLEGYLFPDTYTFGPNTTAREAVRAMLDQFAAKWNPAWNARLDSLGLSRHAIITMASLVEKEARVPAERPVIAAVYWNRVKKGMRLQADPTVQYALPEHVSRLLFVHLEVESPYNTYRNSGLPPGPIASPGLPSIEAALYPVDVPYLFFVAHPDGHHEFRTTFAEHQRAIAMVRRLARERGAARQRADTAPARGEP